MTQEDFIKEGLSKISPGRLVDKDKRTTVLAVYNAEIKTGGNGQKCGKLHPPGNP